MQVVLTRISAFSQLEGISICGYTSDIHLIFSEEAMKGDEILAAQVSDVCT